MTNFNAQVDDLALFFRDDDGTLAQCWVPHDIYTASSRQMTAAAASSLPAGWKNCTVMQCPVDGGGFYYIANLSLLLGPGQAPLTPQAEAPAAVAAPTNGPSPQANDLVIVPYDEPGTAYVVSRAEYAATPNDCPPVDGPDAADLVYMALTEGVVLANVPKPANIQGYTCTLLSLVSLSSGALGSGAEAKDKSAYFARFGSM